MSQDSGLNIVTKRLDLASFSADLVQNITDNGWRTGRMTHGRRFCPAIKYASRSLGKKQTGARAKQILHNGKNLAMPTLPTVRRVHSAQSSPAQILFWNGSSSMANSLRMIQTARLQPGVSGPQEWTHEWLHPANGWRRSFHSALHEE